MPITPLHFGLNASVAYYLRSKVSLTACILANVVCDVQPFLALVVGLPIPVHGISHSFFGATVLNAFVFWMVGLIARKIRSYKVLPFILGGALGGVLHVAFDGLMHADMEPFWPFSNLRFNQDEWPAFVGPVWVAGYVLWAGFRFFTFLRKRQLRKLGRG